MRTQILQEDAPVVLTISARPSHLQSRRAHRTYQVGAPVVFTISARPSHLQSRRARRTYNLGAPIALTISARPSYLQSRRDPAYKHIPKNRNRKIETVIFTAFAQPCKFWKHPASAMLATGATAWPLGPMRATHEERKRHLGKERHALMGAIKSILLASAC